MHFTKLRLRFFHVSRHKLLDGPCVPAPRRIKDRTMSSDRLPTKRLIISLRHISRNDHQAMQHLVDDLAGAPKERVRIGPSQHVMEMDVLVALVERMLMA